MRKIVLIVLVALLPLAACGQETSLQVSRLFKGDVIPTDRMVLTRVRGRQLSKFGLDFYRSARFEASAEEAVRVEHMVAADGEKYGQVEQTTTTGAGTVYICALRSEGSRHRYLCLMNRKEGKRRRAMTVIYMEGTVGSIAELNKMINK